MDRRTEILNVGEALMKRAGYSGFSYADIAREVQIRKASIHYHFPSKSDLAIAAVERYRKQTQVMLSQSNPEEVSLQDALAQFGALFEAGFKGPGQGCLCGSLVADWETLPEDVRANVRAYWDEAEAWLAAAIQTNMPDKADDEIDELAEQIMSLFEGAMMSARVRSRVAPLQAAQRTALSMLGVAT